VHIVHYLDTTDTRRGGPQRMVLDSCRVMAAKGHQCTLLASDTTDAPGAWLAPAPGLPLIRRIPAPTLPGGFYTPAGLRSLGPDLEGADVVHFHCVWSPAAHQIARLARRAGVPYVVSLHGMFDDWAMSQAAAKKRVFLSLGGRALLEHAAAVHCTAEGELAQSRKWFDGRGGRGGRGVVVPPLLDLDPFRSLPGPGLARGRFPFLLEHARPVVLFLSRLHPVKRPQLLLEAAAALRDQGIDATFVLAGPGDEGFVAMLKGMVRDLQLEDRVHFPGLVMGEDKLSLFQAADLFILPTQQENFGVVLIEALACGTPLITTRGVDIWPELKASGAAVIVDDPGAELIREAARLLGDSEARRAMAARARPWVFEAFDEAHTTRQMEALYEQARQTGKAGATGRG
jgi:glycosyltransferase involved in cell wall biosynthesis